MYKVYELYKNEEPELIFNGDLTAAVYYFGIRLWNLILKGRLTNCYYVVKIT